MDKADFRRVLDRLKRSTVNAEMLAFYQEVERLMNDRANPPSPIESPPFDKKEYMRQYMRGYRARKKPDKP